MDQQRRTWPLWIGGIVGVLAAVVLVLAFAPLVKCPDRRSLDERHEGHRESPRTESHRADCALCAGRGRTSVLRWVLICKACGGTGRERGWNFFGSGGEMICSWCNGTGRNPFRVR